MIRSERTGVPARARAVTRAVTRAPATLAAPWPPPGPPPGPAPGPAWDEVVVLCPQLVSGGTEALHQLAHTLDALGVRAALAWFGRSRLEFSGTRLRCHYVPDVLVQQAY